MLPPIMPGNSESITVRYDTRRIGSFHKTITVTSNADNATIVLTIKGKVNPKPQEVAPVKKRRTRLYSGESIIQLFNQKST